jgi:hypothetical protein
MDLHTMNEFRHEVSGCFTHAKNALFNMLDALSTATA